jgi:hypothetical protein
MSVRLSKSFAILPGVLVLALGTPPIRAALAAGLQAPAPASAQGAAQEHGAGEARKGSAPVAPPGDPAVRAGDPAAKGDAWSKPVFAEFYRLVKGALARHDATAMAWLVDYPLHVHHPDGSSISIDNARGLEQHFEEVFPADVRQAVARATDADTVRAGTDAGIANGMIWAGVVGNDKAARYRITEVNLGFDQPVTPPSGLIAVCETSIHRVVVDSAVASGGKLRYRVWNKPHFPPDAPDLILTSGAASSEGTGPCEHDIWTFTQGDTTYTLTELRCGFGTDGPPDDARAQLEVAVKGQVKKSWWCY